MVKGRGSIGKIRVSRAVGCLVLLVLFGIIWMTFEVQAQKTVLAKPLAVYHNPDHRLPNLDPMIGTNSDGLRCALEPEEMAAEGFSVFFCGDSFVFGVQLDREEALPQLFERGLRSHVPDRTINVVNAAWPSASPLLALRLLKDVGEKYRPDLVLYGFDMSDFRDDLMYRNLIEKEGIYRLVDVAPASLWLAGRGVKAVAPGGFYRKVFWMPSDRFFAVNKPLSETRADLVPAWNTLVSIDQFCRDQLDADFRLIVLPRNFQYSDRESPFCWEKGDYQALGPWVLEPFRFFEHQAQDAPFPVHSLLEAFEETDVFPTCYTGDPHWTPAGTQVAADALVRMAVEGGWVEESKPEGGKATD